MPELPDGVVTFLFTDVEGSTRLWEGAPDSMMAAIRQHDTEIEEAAEAHNGVPVRPRGEAARPRRSSCWRRSSPSQRAVPATSRAPTRVSDLATEGLNELEAEIDPAAYEAAFTAGSSRPYDVAAKELIESL